MNSAISRQAALEIIQSMYPGVPRVPWLRKKWKQQYEPYIRMENEIRQLPSVQSEPIKINLNDWIKVKLTDWGKEIYYHQYDRTNQIAGKEICKPKFPKEDENGYTKFQLWCFIELYGEHIGITLQNVIEPLDVIYVGE